MRFEIDNWHPVRLNTLMGVHWSKAWKLKKADKEIVHWYSQGIPKATKKRRVSLEIFHSGKPADPDAYHKSLCDALVHNRLLVDDSPEWVELMPVKFTKGKKRTVIRLEDL